MRRSLSFLVPAVILFCSANAQGLRQSVQASPALRSQGGATMSMRSFQDSVSSQYLSPRISSAECTRHLPFFCRQELALEKRIKLPVRLRLGSVQQADWLESKPGAEYPGK